MLKTQTKNGNLMQIIAHFIFSPTFEVKLKTSFHPPWLPIKAESKDVPAAAILKSDHMNSHRANGHAASSALVPGIAQGCRASALAPETPAATLLPGQQGMKSAHWAAGAAQYSLHVTFIWTSLVLWCLSTHSLFLFKQMTE